MQTVNPRTVVSPPCSEKPVARNTQATIKELLDAVFSVESVSYKIFNMLSKESRRSFHPGNSFLLYEN
jgi:hypothetical protein